MSTSPSIATSSSAFYRDDEPVIQSHPLLPGAIVPRFGDTDRWDLNDVVHRAPHHPLAAVRVLFHDLDGGWNLTARELAMLWLNPRHPAPLAAGVHLRNSPLSPMTVAQRVAHLRTLAAFGAERRLPADLRGWADDDFKNYVQDLAAKYEPGSVCNHVHAIKALHRFRGALSCGGLARDPWPGVSPNVVANHPIVPPVRTPAIPPQTWFSLVRNCWTYIDVFAPDILRADAYLTKSRPETSNGGDKSLLDWLDDPATTVPIRAAKLGERPGRVPNFRLVGQIIGAGPEFFQADEPAGQRRSEAVEALVAAGRTHLGLLPDLTEVTRADGSRGPWHDNLGPTELWLEKVMLRNACYVFTAALSMMRDSELRVITKDALVEYYGSPAVKSTRQKLDPDLPVKHWWIIPPVARAIELAGQLSQHESLTFAAVSTTRRGHHRFASIAAIKQLITHMNRWRHVTGLEAIPDGNVTPHMFRRTMAMLTREFPGSEIAVGMQLKHVTTRALANRVTSSYMDNTPSWARHLETAIADRRFDRLTELFDADTNGGHIGFGPGADRMREAFSAVRAQAEQLRPDPPAQHRSRAQGSRPRHRPEHHVTEHPASVTRQRLRDAMERLFNGEPQHTDGKLTKNNQWREAQVSRATMNRAADVLAEWAARVNDSPAGVAARRRDEELDHLRSNLRASHLERRNLQDQLDAAATVIAALHAENVMLRRQAAGASARIVPLSRGPRVDRR